MRAFSFAQKRVLLALNEAERWVKACAAAQDAGLAIACAEAIERDVELPLARTVLRILKQIQLVRRACGHKLQRADADAAQRIGPLYCNSAATDIKNLLKVV